MFFLPFLKKNTIFALIKCEHSDLLQPFFNLHLPTYYLLFLLE